MHCNPRPCVVIPARFKSTRFPGKPLTKIRGREMVLRVADLAAGAVELENVYVATDSLEISDVVTRAGFKVVITSETCMTGTDRVAEASLGLDYDLFVNVQGDEPLVNPSDIQRVIKLKIEYPFHVINGYTEATDDEVNKRSVPKVVMNAERELLYASRAVIPGGKEGVAVGVQYFKQVCIYAFSADELEFFFGLKEKGPLESIEDIEILRFIECGRKVKMLKCNSGSVAVDYPEDVLSVEKLLMTNDGNL